MTTSSRRNLAGITTEIRVVLMLPAAHCDLRLRLREEFCSDRIRRGEIVALRCGGEAAGDGGAHTLSTRTLLLLLLLLLLLWVCLVGSFAMSCPCCCC